VRLAIDDNGNGPVLRAGMSANVEIDTGRQNSLLGRLQGAKEPEPQTKVAASL
jgi:membrane fusion protein (multidrug efflux system)